MPGWTLSKLLSKKGVNSSTSALWLIGHRDLETMLDCQIATASDLSLLRNAISRPQEKVALYTRLSHTHDTPLCSLLRSKFGDLESLSKVFGFAHEATSQLGNWCADQVWRFALAEEESRKVERKMERMFLRDQENRPMEMLDKELVRLREAKQIVSEWITPPLVLEGNNLSPKVMLLHQYLKLTFEKPTDAKCIIFVKRRKTARLLAQLFRDIGTPHLRPDLLIGSGFGDFGDVRVSFRQQVLTLMKFKKGEINCLFATSIAEEGLDIPDCNLVIRFDLYDTLIQYIQSRGRARHANSKYIHMIEEDNRMHFQGIDNVRLGEKVMRQFCEALPADRLLEGNDGDVETALAKEKGQRKYIDPETGAVLSYANSLIILAHFVGSLVSAFSISMQVPMTDTT
jgi:endoribonuclease Dicer